MQSQAVSPVRSTQIEVDAASRTVIWRLGGDPVGRATTVPWFPGIGVLDYARTTPPRRPQSSTTPDLAGPVFGDPLIVRTDLAAVFWRVSSVLYSAPIRRGRVDLDAAAVVDWTAADHARLRVIEHNLAQSSALPTLDPPLHVVQVERSGRLSLSTLVADVNGSPVIGPTPRHYQPYLSPGQLATATAQGLDALAAMWEQALRSRTADGIWRFVSPDRALETLAGLGFVVTGAAARRPGLTAALHGEPGTHWIPGWYGGTRLLALARFEQSTSGGDRQYAFHKPGSRRVAVAADADGRHRDMLCMQGPADVEDRPHGERVYVESGYLGGGMALPVAAGRVALHEPVLVDGPLPVLDHQVSWSATCRRCGAPMSCGLVGRYDFVPYLHELAAEVPGRGPADLWCDAHPSTDRRRPHAPICQVIAPPELRR